MIVTIMCDGGCENNQVPSLRWAYGSFVIMGTMPMRNDEVELKRRSKIIFGNATNNEAEYLALINALSELGTIHFPETMSLLRIKTDSQLVINQVCGRWEINHSNLQMYAKVVREILNNLKSMNINIAFNHIPRDRIVEVLGH